MLRPSRLNDETVRNNEWTWYVPSDEYGPFIELDEPSDEELSRMRQEVVKIAEWMKTEEGIARMSELDQASLEALDSPEFIAWLRANLPVSE